MPAISFSLSFRAQTWLVAAVIVLAVSGCASRQAESFAGGKPVFDPGQYFRGHTHSWGIVESRSGAPGQTLRTETHGRWAGGIFHFEQDLAFGNGKCAHRSWKMSRVDAHHYKATGTGIVGEARGEAYGNAFHLEFTLDLFPGNPLGRVHMSQWMYLQEDGRTMVNRDVKTTDARPFWRPAEVSPSNFGYHWNHNAESHYLNGKAMGEKMLEMLGH